MSEVLDSLGNFIEEESQHYFQSASFLCREYHAKSRCLDLKLQLEQPLPYEVYHGLIHNMRMHFHTDVKLSVQANSFECGMEDLDRYVQDLIAQNTPLRPFSGLHPYQENGSICFMTKDESQHYEIKRAKPLLEEKLKVFGIETDFVCKLEEEQMAQPVVVEMPKPQEKITVQKPAAASSYQKNRQPAQVYKISELQEGINRAIIEGHVISVEYREVGQNKRTLQTIYISDYEDAFVAKCWESKKFTREEMEKINVGMSVRLTGNVAYDVYEKNLTFQITECEQIEAKKRRDNSSDKRVEWHVHSNFSEMDGVSGVDEYIQTAFDWGMDAIGITDHDVVQAFPHAQKKVDALLKNNPDRQFKVLYGCEMDMVDLECKNVVNNDHRSLKDATYVVFDLETTGLSNRLDAIIEFGAVKMKNREVIDRKQMFINPQREIPADIINLTHITQQDVNGAPTIEQALDEILAFIGDSILVAHNGKFDLGFLNAACRQCNREELTNPMIDTLPLAQCLMDMKSYRLGSVCRHYNVPYDGEGAHRADYDAEVLSSCLCFMLNEFDTESTLDQLMQFDMEQHTHKMRPSHICVYAKNKEGLKELFKLVTLSHTTYLAYKKPAGNKPLAYPRIPRQVLEQFHESGNLLYGSACQNGEVFDLAQTRSQADLAKAMEFYDYIEIQPLDNYRNLVDRNSIHSADDLKKIITFILDQAKEMNKLVIATSDAHYVEPHDKRIRDIYINAKVIGGGRHPLYIYNPTRRKATQTPNQHLRTTDEMLNEFSWLDEVQARDIVINNTRELTKQCEVIYPTKDKLYPPEIEGSDQKLRDICFETAHKIYGEQLPDIVEKRLTRELDSIIGAGYYVVYYISHLLVKKSNEDGYIVGSRGSVGSSFAATMSGITEVNPLTPHYICPHCHHYEFIEEPTVASGFDLPDKECPICHQTMRGDGQDIPFETFLGFEGDKVPDIDLNFSGEYQPNAHNYCKEVFGEEYAFRAGTVGTVQEKTAYGYIKGYAEEMEIESFSKVKQMDLAKGCEGVKRTTGQHPGGIIVVPNDMDVHDFTPVQYPANDPNADWKTTHFDFHQIHDNILKFDILGHVDPTAMKMLERISGLDVTKIPMNDPETMSIFSTTEALKIDSTKYDQKTGAAGIPEFGTNFVRRILEKTKPTTFGDLVTISGLSHGTDVWSGNAESLIDAGICQLSDVIGCRDDIMVALMSYGLESKLAFTIMESVRKGKGLNDDWIKEMKAHDVPDWYIESCQKIKYMFPKAHAVAYVTMAIRIAWFKVHMPLVYYCMFFSIRCKSYDIQTMIAGEHAIRERMSALRLAIQERTASNKDKEVFDTLELALEMYCRGFHFSNININRSAATEFIIDPDDEKAIIPPFTSLDGLGENVALSIVKAREEKSFLSKEDVLKRTQLSKTLLETLDKMNSMDGLDDENQMKLF